MDERQAFLAVRNALRLENLSLDTAAKVAPELAAAFRIVGDALRSLPPGSLEREIAYKQLRLRLATIFKSSNDAFYLELRRVIDEEVYRQVRWAQDWLRIAEATPKQLEVAGIPQPGLSVSPTAPTAVTLGGGEITRTQLVAIGQKTEVLGKRMEELFGIDGSASIYIRDNIKAIDRQVKIGFMAGHTNEEIARNIVQTVGYSAKGTARTIARTAVMDMSQRAHETFWDAQDAEVIPRWQFDATFDYRVCMQCAPWDGKESTKRSNLPRVPVHPNCRCRVLPVTATELELRRSGESLKQEGDRSYVEITKEKPRSGRVYKQQVRVDGKKYYKVAREAAPKDGKAMTMAEFLVRANNETRAAVMGKENAQRFYQMVKGTKGTKAPLTPEEALREIVRNPYRRRK